MNYILYLRKKETCFLSKYQTLQINLFKSKIVDLIIKYRKMTKGGVENIIINDI
jgi:hypothetical protein